MYEHYYKGKLVAASEDLEEPKLSVWEVFEEYADVRDELEDLLDGFRSIREDIELAVYDLEGDLEDIEDHLSRCDRVFRRFKAKRRREEKKYEERHCEYENEGKEELPFDGLPVSHTEPFSLM